jgi:hypothetical protein
MHGESCACMCQVVLQRGTRDTLNSTGAKRRRSRGQTGCKTHKRRGQTQTNVGHTRYTHTRQAPDTHTGQPRRQSSRQPQTTSDHLGRGTREAAQRGPAGHRVKAYKPDRPRDALPRHKATPSSRSTPEMRVSRERPGRTACAAVRQGTKQRQRRGPEAPERLHRQRAGRKTRAGRPTSSQHFCVPQPSQEATRLPERRTRWLGEEFCQVVWITVRHDHRHMKASVQQRKAGLLPTTSCGVSRCMFASCSKKVSLMKNASRCRACRCYQALHARRLPASLTPACPVLLLQSLVVARPTYPRTRLLAALLATLSVQLLQHQQTVQDCLRPCGRYPWRRIHHQCERFGVDVYESGQAQAVSFVDHVCAMQR